MSEEFPFYRDAVRAMAHHKASSEAVYGCNQIRARPDIAPKTVMV